MQVDLLGARLGVKCAVCEL